MDESLHPLDLDTQLMTLRAAHRALDERIAQLAAEALLGGPDRLELARLKRQKLHLKDRIAHLESDRLPDIIA